MTLNGVMAVILRYFSEFGELPGALRKSSRSLSHLLMSSCRNLAAYATCETANVVVQEVRKNQRGRTHARRTSWKFVHCMRSRGTERVGQSITEVEDVPVHVFRDRAFAAAVARLRQSSYTSVDLICTSPSATN